jgi:hypothetical protein
MVLIGLGWKVTYSISALEEAQVPESWEFMDKKELELQAPIPVLYFHLVPPIRSRSSNNSNGNQTHCGYYCIVSDFDFDNFIKQFTWILQQFHVLLQLFASEFLHQNLLFLTTSHRFKRERKRMDRLCKQSMVRNQCLSPKFPWKFTLSKVVWRKWIGWQQECSGHIERPLEIQPKHKHMDMGCRRHWARWSSCVWYQGRA